jgi:hypothetical protein
MDGIPEWEELRSRASAIKEHTLTHLDEYLDQFKANAVWFSREYSRLYGPPPSRDTAGLGAAQ